MSRKPEQRLWDTLRPRLVRAGLRALRVENLLDDGFPDAVVQSRATHLTLLELKARPCPPSSPHAAAMGAAYGLRLSQRNWWLAYRLMGGGRGLIVARVGAQVYAHDARHAEEYNIWRAPEFRSKAIGLGMDAVVSLINSHDWECKT